jgi:ketosteroid isomerase-like protein
VRVFSRGKIKLGADIKALMKRFETAFMSKDVDAVMECLAPRFEWHLPDGTQVRGLKAVRAALEARLNAPGGPRFSHSKFAYYGDTVIQTYRVSFKGADGKPRQTRGLDVYKTVNGLIARKDAYWKRTE